MNKNIRQELEAEGWEFGSAQDFLDLNDVDTKYVEFKMALKKAVKEYRLNADLSQASLASNIESSQSRIAKIEAGDTSVSIDLMIRAFFGTGADKEDLATIISPEIRSELNAIKAGNAKINETIDLTKKQLSWLEIQAHKIQSSLSQIPEYRLVASKNTGFREPSWNTFNADSSVTH